MRKQVMKTAAVLMAVVLCITCLPADVQAASNIKMNKSKVTLYTGGTTTLKVSGTSRKASWSSSKKSVATVSSKGKVTAKKPGKATITAKVGSKKLTCRVTVKKESPKLNKTKVTLYPKGTTTLKVTGTSRQVKFSSSKKSVATVSSKGKVTAKKPGTAVITAKVGSKKVTCKVTVKEKKQPGTSVSIYWNGEKTVKAAGAVGKVDWETSNKSIVTVESSGNDKAVLTGKKVGTATVTAKAAGKTVKRYDVRVKMKTGALTEREELLAEYVHEKYDDPYIFCTTSELEEIGITRAEDEPKLWITHKKALVMARKLLPGRDIHIVDVDSLEEVARKEIALEKRGAKYVSMQTMYHNHGDIKKWSVCWIE